MQEVFLKKISKGGWGKNEIYIFFFFFFKEPWNSTRQLLEQPSFTSSFSAFVPSVLKPPVRSFYTHARVYTFARQLSRVCFLPLSAREAWNYLCYMRKRASTQVSRKTPYRHFFFFSTHIYIKKKNFFLASRIFRRV